MKKLIVAIVSTLVLVAAAKAAQPSLLTSLQTISAVSNDRGQTSNPPVSIEATVTFDFPLENLLYVQDDGNAIFVLAPVAPLKLLRGDRSSESRERCARVSRPIITPIASNSAPL